jgi:hypothetical protein
MVTFLQVAITHYFKFSIFSNPLKDHSAQNMHSFKMELIHIIDENPMFLINFEEGTLS